MYYVKGFSFMYCNCSTGNSRMLELRSLEILDRSKCVYGPEQLGYKMMHKTNKYYDFSQFVFNLVFLKHRYL